MVDGNLKPDPLDKPRRRGREERKEIFKREVEITKRFLEKVNIEVRIFTELNCRVSFGIYTDKFNDILTTAVAYREEVSRHAKHNVPATDAEESSARGSKTGHVRLQRQKKEDAELQGNRANHSDDEQRDR